MRSTLLSIVQQCEMGELMPFVHICEDLELRCYLLNSYVKRGSILLPTRSLGGALLSIVQLCEAWEVCVKLISEPPGGLDITNIIDI